MCRKKLLKKEIICLMVILLIVGLLQIKPNNMIIVQASDSSNVVKSVAGLCTGSIANPIVPTSENDAWKGSYVYFGTFGGNPTKYRVLDSNTTVYGGTTMLVDCDGVLWHGNNPSSAFDTDSNVWADSDIRTYLNSTFLNNNYSALEKIAIAESVKSEAHITDGNNSTNFVSLNGEKLFLLDAREVRNTSYGYNETLSDVTSRVKDGGFWRLRSPASDDSIRTNCIGSSGGVISLRCGYTNIGVSPALNINLESVIFSSVVSGTSGQIGAEYKLTLLDEEIIISVNNMATRNGDNVNISYSISGKNSSNATQVSVLILDKEYTEGNTNGAKILAYNKLNVDSFSTSGTGTFKLPSSVSDKICGRDYYAYILAEDINGTYESDYASTPAKISIPWMAKEMELGTKAMIAPVIPTNEGDAWIGSYVYFGTYNGDIVKYRVLDRNTSVFGGTTMLLDCDSILWSGSNPSSTFDLESNVWEDSDIKIYLNDTFFKSSFSLVEQGAIAESSKPTAHTADGNITDYFEYVPLTGEKIFFLDIVEIKNANYGYYNTDSRTASRVKKGGNYRWWLRTKRNGDVYVAYITDLGIIHAHLKDANNAGVSPALNIDLSSILFSSICGLDKSLVITENSEQIGTKLDTGWKLTLIDTGKTVKITDNKKVIKEINGTITVPYTYNDTAITDEEKVNQLSVMITDKEYMKEDAKILYYGALQGVDFATTSGTGTFSLPRALEGQKLGRDYHIYIVAEHVNTTNATDYASVPVEIANIYEEVTKVAVMDITAPVAKNAFDTTAIVTSEIENANIIWMNNNREVTGDAGYNTAYTVKVTLTAKEGYVFAESMEVTINDKVVEPIKNTDGTVTVSYTFPTTAIGTIVYTATGHEGIYDGKRHSITVNVAEPKDAIVTYSTDEGNSKVYSVNKPEFIDTGIYTVYYKIEMSDYSVVMGSEIVDISKKTVIVAATDQTITEGDDIDVSKYIVTGLLDGDKINDVILMPSTSEVTTKGSITVSIDMIADVAGKNVTDNYEIIYIDGKLVVEEKETTSNIEEPTEEETTEEEITEKETTEEEITEEETTEEETTEENNSEENTPGGSTSEGGINSEIEDSPDTSDDIHIFTWMILIVASGFMMVYFSRKRNDIC